MSNEYLHLVRGFELGLALEQFPKPLGRPVRVLELGAGTGHQAKCLSELGYDVIAIDLPSSAYADERVFPVADYDGYNLPVPSCSVDVVFSSNVLEHVPHVNQLLRETARVLAKGGIAIHILPTSAWRWWTSFTHYGWVISRLSAALIGRQRIKRFDEPGQKQKLGTWATIKSLAWPARHGERGNTVTEAVYFSQYWWSTIFRKAGFDIKNTFPVGLFYTGSMLMAERLSLTRRSALSRWLGSSCRVYVLVPARQAKAYVRGQWDSRV